MIDTEKHTPPTSRTLPIDSFHQAKRILKLFNDAEIEGPMPFSREDATPTMLYRTITSSTHEGALTLLAEAVELISPHAQLRLSDHGDTTILVPVSVSPQFPIHQLEQSLEKIREDLLGAISQRSDGTFILETQKFKHLKPDDGIELIASLYDKYAELYGPLHNVAQGHAWILPENTRFMAADGKLHSHVGHKTYQHVMAHRATVDGATLTEELPQRTGKYIEMDKRAYNALLKELGITAQAQEAQRH